MGYSVGKGALERSREAGEGSACSRETRSGSSERWWSLSFLSCSASKGMARVVRRRPVKEGEVMAFRVGL